MDKELELENKFIQLWNDGHSYDEIAEEISVDIEKIRQWGTDLIIANNSFFNQNKYALEKNSNSRYLPSDGIEYPERVLFKLRSFGKENKFWDYIRLDLPYNTSINSYSKSKNKLNFLCKVNDYITLKNKSNGRIKKDISLLSLNLRFRKDENVEIQIILINSIMHFTKGLTKSTHNLPYAIRQFKFQCYKEIKKIEVSDLPINSNWIFLTGENGYGKTTVLKALANSLTKVPSYNKTKCGIQRLGVEFFNNLGRLSFYHINELHNQDKIVKLKNFAAYGPFRLSLQDAESQNEKSRRSESLYNLFYSDGILLNIEYRLFISSLKDIPKFEKIKQLLISVVPDLKNIIVDKESEKIFYIEKSHEGEPYKPVKFDELAAGYKSIIAMVGDIYLRLSKNQPDVEIKDLGGIVLIDELDVHLHPKWQRALPGLLSKAFPKVQFIASTHSPIPFLGAPKNAVFLKVDRTPEEGITCKRIDIDVTNLTPNLILTSPIFGFGNITSVNAEEIGEVETEDTYEKLKENEELRKRLLEFENSERDFPDELFERKEAPVKPTE